MSTDDLRNQRAAELDDVDCCIRHYVQWVHGWRLTDRCSEGVDPEMQAAAARAYEHAAGGDVTGPTTEETRS